MKNMTKAPSRSLAEKGKSVLAQIGIYLEQGPQPALDHLHHDTPPHDYPSTTTSPPPSTFTLYK